MKKHSFLLFSIVFYLGVLFGFLLTSMAALSDMEAASYGFARTGGERLGTLYCPILMTKGESGTFSVKVVNTTDKKIASSVRTDIAARFDPVSSLTFVELAPGEAKQINGRIGPENLVLGQFIFARASVNAYPLPSRENVCGVFIVDLPTNGRAITWILVGLSLLGIGIGLYGLTRPRTSKDSRQIDIKFLILLAFLSAAGIISSFLGWWIQGLLVVILIILIVFVSLVSARK